MSDGFSVEDAIEMLRWAGYEVTRKSPPNHRTLKKDPARYRMVESLVNAGASIKEIERTTGTDHRTIRSHWPNYRPFEVGGGGDAAVIRETNRQLREFLRRGKIGKNRDAGFDRRGDK